jgi:phosphomethylpyrimidine synthase
MSGEKPFYMLGPLVTDIAPGYDNMVAAIGASLSSAYGADFICYVTPAEHLALPNEEDVRTGVMSARLAAHIGDMIKYGERERDLEMGHARKNLDWNRMYELALDPAHAKEVRASRMPEDKEACTMCGNYCALKIVKANLNL